MSDNVNFALMACMKNEGPFVVEWVAYHRAIGFDTILVATNDCEDGTDQISQRLADLGYVKHIANQIGEGETPQRAGVRAVRDALDGAQSNWLLHIDADEFLNVSAGAGQVQDLTALTVDADAIAILWRSFGHNDVGYWRGGNVLQSFTRTHPSPMKRSIGHKTLYRLDAFASGIDHMPKQPTGKPRLVNTLGERVNANSLGHPTRARFRMGWDATGWQ